jgi:ABC-type phosphate transport system substrate-binding protein
LTSNEKGFSEMEDIRHYIPILLKRIKPVILAGVLSYFSAAQADIAVIVNSKNAGLNLSRSAVGDIFLGRTNTLPNGNSVRPIDLNNREETRSSFYRLVAEKNAAEMNVYWSRLNFVGRGSPPMVLQNDQAVIDFVKGNTTAIGYVNASLAKGINGVAIALLIPV